MSFRINKNTSAAFGLCPSEEDSTLFMDRDDNSRWIEQKYFDKLSEVLTCIFEHHRNIMDDKLKNALKILRLHEDFNRSAVLCKSDMEIDSDYEKWLEISKIVRYIIQKA